MRRHDQAGCRSLRREPERESALGAIRSIAAADLLIVGGTSLAVYPAAGLLQYFEGDALALINKGATPMDKNADLLIQQPIGQVLGSIKVR